MPIGERIKQARRMGDLSQQELAARVGVSAQAISKYERELDIPSSGVLLRLGQALAVPVGSFIRPVRVGEIKPAFRKRVSLAQRDQEAIIARIRAWLEQYLEIELLLELGARTFALPEGFPCSVSSLAAVEPAAIALRQAWDLGLDPIENLTELLEDRGVKVHLVDGPEKFDACTFWATVNGGIPVIAVREGVPGDRQRFSLAHELAHLLLQPAGELDEEKVANRFAGAFLAPVAAVRFELGPKRHFLDLVELCLLKRKYGLSMGAWIYRAKDLEILSESSAAGCFRWLRARGWHKEEPGPPLMPERPSRMKRLVLRALAEEVITESRAAELLGVRVAAFRRLLAEECRDLAGGVCGGYERLD